MVQLRITLETVTPLFLGGADARGEPELRPAAFKGALRYWWRALWGGVHPTAGADALYEAESKLFGNTSQASPVVVRLANAPRKTEKWRDSYDTPGVNYLFFSLKGNRKQSARVGFSAGQQFDLRLGTRPGATNGDEALKHTCAALWLLVRFGALGARSRRGAGCLRVMDEPKGWPEGLPSLVSQAATSAQLAQELKHDLTKLYEALGWTVPQGKVTAWPKYDILHPHASPFYTMGKKQGWSTWQDALDDLGASYQQFRSRRQPDYQQVKDVVSGNKHSLPTVERAAFGLPIVFYYRSLGGQGGTVEARHHDRRTSPLHFHVSRLKTGKYAISVGHFRSQLLPAYEDLKVKRRGRPVAADSPSFGIVTDFFKEMMFLPREKCFVAKGFRINRV